MQEIRIRSDKPLSLFLGNKSVFVTANSTVTAYPASNAYITSSIEVDECYKSLCEYSVHTYINQLVNGYITINGGHRAGICSTAVIQNNQVVSVKEITSINIRISREIKNAAEPIIKNILKNKISSLIIAGPPSSGKTTMLRDIARMLSSGFIGEYYKVCIVDERSEIAACSSGKILNDVGICCDVLNSFDKADGIQMAIRTLSPQLIICDELCTDKEIEAIKSGLYSGVNIITSIHCGSIDEINTKPQLIKLIKSGAFEKLVMLSGSDAPCKIKEIIDLNKYLQT